MEVRLHHPRTRPALRAPPHPPKGSARRGPSKRWNWRRRRRPGTCCGAWREATRERRHLHKRAALATMIFGGLRIASVSPRGVLVNGKRIVTYVEIDRCMTDAIGLVANCP